MLRNARYAAVLLILIFLAPAWAMAQDQWAGRWWDRPRIAERLDITAGEKASLDDLYNQARRNLLDLKNEVEKQRLELEIALEAQPLNKDAAMGVSSGWKRHGPASPPSGSGSSWRSEASWAGTGSRI